MLESVPERGLRSDKLCQGGNSGYQAINLAYMQGARVVILLGYVMSGRGDHFFGRHPAELDQNADYSQFQEAFTLMKPENHGLKVINCTENTALECFERMPLDDAIAQFGTGWREAVVIASGPSVTHDDVEKVRRWRFEPGYEHTRGVVVTNNSFRIAPWADVLYAMDQNWWDVMGKEAKATFTGELLTNKSVNYPGVTKGDHFIKHRAGMNSGSGAISVAVHRGAEKVVLLGCDGCYMAADGTATFDQAGSKKHWHGDHARGLGNAKSVKNFNAQFKHMADAFKGRALIVNCSPVSIVDCFPKATLDEALSP